MGHSLQSSCFALLLVRGLVIFSSIGISDNELLPRIVGDLGCQPEERSPVLSIGCIFRSLYKPKAGFGDKRSRVGQSSIDVYGEVLTQGTQQLMEAVPERALAEDDVFFDLGSGTGKATIQVFLTSPVRRAVGVELDTGRHDHGSQALASLKKILPLEEVAAGQDLIRAEGRELELIKGDILQTNLNEATVIFIASLAFSATLLKEVQDHLLHSALPGTIIMLQTKLPGCPRGFVHLADAKAAVSWGGSTTIYIYLIATPLHMAELVESSGAEAILEKHWNASETQLERLRSRIRVDRTVVALHQERGNKQSDVECDAANLIAIAMRGLSDANATISRMNLDRTDHLGRRLLWYICDAHTNAENSAGSMFATFGNDAGGFAKHAREKQQRLYNLTQMLLEHGADANLPDHKGQTALQEASLRGDNALMNLLEGGSLSRVHAGEL